MQVDTRLKFFTGALPTLEDVSCIYGVAIPFAVEWKRQNSIPDIERILSPVLFQAEVLYSQANVVSIAERACHGTLNSVDRAKISELFAIFETQTNNSSIKGRELVLWFRENQHAMVDMRFFGFCEQNVYDSIFVDEHFDRLGQCYDKEEKTVLDFMYLGSAANAFTGTHEVFVQTGFDYSWTNVAVFEEAVRRLDEVLPECFFECDTYVRYDPVISGPTRAYNSIVGRVDAITAERIIYECKFTSALSSEHELQTLLYAAIDCVSHEKDESTAHIVNVRTNEHLALTIDHEHAVNLLQETGHMMI